MSAVNAMFAHRYGAVARSRHGSYGASHVGEIVATEMFGEDEFDEDDPPNFDEASLLPGYPERQPSINPFAEVHSSQYPGKPGARPFAIPLSMQRSFAKMLGEDIPEFNEPDEGIPEFEEPSENIPEFNEQPLFPSHPTGQSSGIPPSVQGAIASFIARVKNAFPYIDSYEVRGGQDVSGNGYAQLSIDAHDPHGFLQKTASWALQSAGMNNVLVKSVPVTMTPGKIVLIFSQGPMPSQASDFHG